MNCELIAVGTEILLGDILNTNARYMSLELAKIGVNVRYHSVVGDNPDRMRELISQALSRSDIVITCGGLGPTPDDLTKEICAECLGLELYLDEKALEQITAYYKRSGRTMPENNEKQAYMPRGAKVFYNENGTAPGCAVSANGKIIINLPGPPRELCPMFEKYVIPMLVTKGDGIFVSHNVGIIGVGESKVALMLSDLFEGVNPTAAPYAKTGECRIRVTGVGDSADEADRVCKPVIEEIRRRVGEDVYGVDEADIESVVVRLLSEQGKTIACAESCTGGLLAKRITDISGASAVFGYSIVSYANEIKRDRLGVSALTLERFGAVSEQTAAEMAQRARINGAADIGVSTTGIAGPTGGSEEKPVGLCYIGVSDSEKTEVVKVLSGLDKGECREANRVLFSTRALDLVRRRLEER